MWQPRPGLSSWQQRPNRHPQSGQISVTLEQALSRDLVLSVGYLRNSTWHLQRRLVCNLTRAYSPNWRK